MRNCRVYLKNSLDPIYITNYIGHKIRRHGYSEFYGLYRTYYIQDKDIQYISVDVETKEDDKNNC